MKMKRMVLLLAACALTVAATAHAEAAAVAKIGEKEYEDVRVAFGEIQSGETLKMIADGEISSAGFGIYIEQKKDLVFDLNGFTLTAKPMSFNREPLVLVKSGLTIIDSSSDGQGQIVVEMTDEKTVGATINISDSSFTLSKGTIKTPSLCVSAFFALGSSEVTIEGGKIEVTGEENYAVVSQYDSDYADGEKRTPVVKINAGEIKGNIVVGEACITEITGGSVDGIFYVEEEANLNISGGTFTDESVKEYISDDIIVNSDGSFTVAAKATEITTENVGVKTGADDTMATGFMTTIKNGGKIDTIRWTVKSGDASADSDTYNVDATIGGDAVLGLVVNGLYDASATATAVINE